VISMGSRLAGVAAVTAGQGGQQAGGQLGGMLPSIGRLTGIAGTGICIGWLHTPPLAHGGMPKPGSPIIGGHGMPGHGMPGHGMTGHGMPGHGMPGHGMPGHGMPGHGGGNGISITA
jgi:hypothetical protein